MADEPPIVTAALIIIGNEILSGRTRDANIPFLAQRLNDLGVRLGEVRIVPDLEEAIVEAVNDCRAAFDYVFTTGGIGPTHDDITAASIAKAFGLKLMRNPEAVERLHEHYGADELNVARLRMANTPEGAGLIENPVSKAPGFFVENVFVFAGVPTIMRAMFENVKHMISGGATMRSRTIAAFLLEGEVAEGLDRLQERYDDLEIGSDPFLRDGKLGTSVVLRGTASERIDEAARELIEHIRYLGGEPVEDSGEAR